jgi:hypothetical protein
MATSDPSVVAAWYPAVIDFMANGLSRGLNNERC